MQQCTTLHAMITSIQSNSRAITVTVAHRKQTVVDLIAATVLYFKLISFFEKHFNFYEFNIFIFIDKYVIDDGGGGGKLIY